MILRSAGQLRMGMGGPVGLDYGAVLAFARAMGGAPAILIELLPVIESIILEACRNAEGSES